MDTFKRILSLFLAFVMLVGIIPPTAANASETELIETVETVAQIQETEAAVAEIGTVLESIAQETTEPLLTQNAVFEAETLGDETEGTTVPTDGILLTEPQEETTAPTEETTEPTEGTTAPTEETTEPTEGTTAPTEAELTTVVVHFYNSAAWDRVSALVWDSAESNAEAPGTALTEVPEHELWYDLTVIDDDGLFTCAFTDGTSQTEEITVDYSDGTVEYWYLENDLTAEEPIRWTIPASEITRAQWV